MASDKSNARGILLKRYSSFCYIYIAFMTEKYNTDNMSDFIFRLYFIKNRNNSHY